MEQAAIQRKDELVSVTEERGGTTSKEEGIHLPARPLSKNPRYRGNRREGLASNLP